MSVKVLRVPNEVLTIPKTTNAVVVSRCFPEPASSFFSSMFTFTEDCRHIPFFPTFVVYPILTPPSIYHSLCVRVFVCACFFSLAAQFGTPSAFTALIVRKRKGPVRTSAVFQTVQFTAQITKKKKVSQHGFKYFSLSLNWTGDAVFLYRHFISTRKIIKNLKEKKVVSFPRHFYTSYLGRRLEVTGPLIRCKPRYFY